MKLLNKEQFFRLCVLTNFVNLLVFRIILYIEEFPVVVGPIGGKICPWFQGVVGGGEGVVPLWSVYTTTPSPHLMSYCVSRSSGSQRRGIRLWFSTRWASHFSLHYVTKQKGSLCLIFYWYFQFWKHAICIPLSFSPKQNFIYIQKGFLLPPAGVNICPPYATDCFWFG